MRLLFTLIYIASFVFVVFAADTVFWTAPFYRTLSLQNPPLNGDDVTIAQSLLARSPFVKNVTVSGIFTANTLQAVGSFQKGNNLTVSGALDMPSSNLLLQLHIRDGYKDPKPSYVPPGVLYKVYIPVYANRSIETTATLYNNLGQSLWTFTVRTQGQADNNTGLDMNELADSGSTPTGLSTFDLNSPENDPIDYGPYPVNREVTGLAGNAAIVISNIRDGILMHTGEWSGWQPPMPMPRSHGCVHGWPMDIERVWQILIANGVQVRNNTFGHLPYPYTPQGLISIEQID